jgi:LuxR family maltose regulon positive regulatory protein
MTGEMQVDEGGGDSFLLAGQHGQRAGRDLLRSFGVAVGAEELTLLHQRSEGWAAALQMAALSLRGTADPGHVVRALEVRSHGIAGYFISEVLDQQPDDVAQFMLDTSILGELTADGQRRTGPGIHDRLPGAR